MQVIFLPTGQFCMLFLSSADFFKINFFEKVFQEYHQSVKQLGSSSGLTFVGLIWLQTVCKSYQQTAPVGKKAGLTLSPTHLIRWFGGNMISESSLLVSGSFSLASLLLALVDLRGTLP